MFIFKTKIISNYCYNSTKVIIRQIQKIILFICLFYLVVIGSKKWMGKKESI